MKNDPASSPHLRRTGGIPPRERKTENKGATPACRNALRRAGTGVLRHAQDGERSRTINPRGLTNVKLKLRALKKLFFSMLSPEKRLKHGFCNGLNFISYTCAASKVPSPPSLRWRTRGTMAA
jgi:hypothetical protein